MSNGKKLRKMVQNGQINTDPNGEIIPGDGVEEPRGLVGFFIKSIRFGRKVWNKTPTPVKVGLGAVVLAGAGAAGAKIGYGAASKKYKPELQDDEHSEEVYYDENEVDNTEPGDEDVYVRMRYGDDPVIIETPETTETPVTETETTE